MKLELFSVKNDVLELNIGAVRPQLKIGELVINGECKVWNAQWENLIIRDFVEDFDIVKEKVQKFYNDENLATDGTSKRAPGFTRLVSTQEEWTLQNSRIIGCSFDDSTKKIIMEVAFDGCGYKTIDKSDIRDTIIVEEKE